MTALLADHLLTTKVRPVSRCSVLATVVVCLAAGPAAAKPGEYLKKPDAWFAGDEAK